MKLYRNKYFLQRIGDPIIWIDHEPMNAKLEDGTDIIHYRTKQIPSFITEDDMINFKISWLKSTEIKWDGREYIIIFDKSDSYAGAIEMAFKILNNRNDQIIYADQWDSEKILDHYHKSDFSKFPFIDHIGDGHRCSFFRVMNAREALTWKYNYGPFLYGQIKKFKTMGEKVDLMISRINNYNPKAINITSIIKHISSFTSRYYA